MPRKFHKSKILNINIQDILLYYDRHTSSLTGESIVYNTLYRVSHETWQ